MTHGTRGESTMLATRLNVGQEDEMELTGYRLSRPRQVVVWSFILLTVGLLRLVFYWKPEWMLKCTHIPCHITCAQKVLLKDQYGQWFVETIKHPMRKTHLDSPTAMQPHSASHHVMTSAELSSPLSSPLLHDRSTRQLSNNVAYFMNKKMKYLWNSSANTFDKLCGLEVGYMCSQLHDLQPLTDQEAENRRLLYGDNNIVVHVVSVVKLLFTQVLNPFYVFQLFSVIVWYNDQYHYYATCILIVSICSITLTIYQTRKMQRALKSTLTAESMVSVCRDGKYIDIPSRDLSPGDIFEVPRLGCDMHCDAVVLQGNCIVNESMLTGESVPVTKTPLPNPKYHSTSDVPFTMKEHSRHILFCGTHVIQTRYYGMHRVKAVVIRTGFFTSKGELVRSILFPKPVDFKFTQDAFKFILVMCALAMVGMIYTIVIMIDRERGASIIILRTLDMVTIVIPPALPAAMTVGIVFAQGRLKKALVYCISPRSINLCGAINAFCFDKTGTLTEEGLDTWGVVPVKQARMMTPCREPCTLENDAPVLCCMATCHSLTIIDGEISGDTLDLKMFEATNWDFLESGEDETGNYEKMNPTRVKPKTPDLVDSTTAQGNINQETLPFEIGIIRQFTFSSSLQRMSVVTSRLGSTQFDLYTKGSPEMIASLCDPKSVPVDFHTSLMEYTRKGYRVIALAWKPKLKLKIHKIYKAQREQLECGLQLLGLLVMENRLKPETTPTIEELKYANIRTIMVTGDNMLTALSVSRDCKMIDADDSVVLVHAQEIGSHSPTPLMMDTPHCGNSHLGYHGNDKIRVEWLVDEHTPLNDVEIKRDSVAIPLDRYHFLMTGKTWALLRQHQPELLPKICVRGTVFARMSPEQKAQLVEVLQEVGYYVGMCGDGANDCGALRCAHAGISLSEAEASIASSFTSKMNNIQCVPTVIREGRAALVTSFGIFKYMACYSLTQFVTVCILYWIAANLTDFTYLYVDMILITSLSITYGYTGAHSKLARTPPEVSLLSLTPLLSIFLQMSVITAVQVLTWFMLREQSWFVEFVPNDDEDYQCYEVTALFSISSFQYIILGFVFSRGAPYRKPVYTNIPFMLNFVALTLLTMYIVLDPFTWLRDLLELQLADSFWFRASYIGVAAANFVIGIILEYMINDFAWVQRKLRSLSRACSRRAHASEYERIESELNENGSSWPPVSTSTMSIADVLRVESQQQTSSNEATGIESCEESTHTTHDSSKISETHDSTLNSTLNSTLHDDSHIELHGISHNTIL